MNKAIYYGYWLIVAAFFAQFIAIGMYSYVLGAFMVPMLDDLGWSRADFTLTVGCAMLGNLVVNVTLSKWFVLNRGKAVAWAAMGVSFGGVVITPWITWVIDQQGWREAWLWLAAFCAVFAYPVALVMRRAPEDHGLYPDGLSEEQWSQGRGQQAAQENLNAFTRRQALRTVSFYGLVFAFGFFAINIVVILLKAMPYLSDHGFSRNQGAMAMIVASIPAMLSKPVWGFLIDRMRVKPLAAISASTTGVALFCIIAAVNYQNIWIVYAAFFLLGLGWGGMIPMQEVIWARFFGRLYLGSIRGAAMPFTLLLGAVAPWAVAYYYDVSGSYDAALMVVAGLNVLSGLLIFSVPPPRR